MTSLLGTPLEVCLLVSQSLAIRLFYVYQTQNHKKTDQTYNDRRKIVVRYVSFLHALIVSVGSLICVYRSPFCLFGYRHAIDARTVLILRHTLMFSMSYFMYDFCDMIGHGEFNKYKEYLVHHICACFAQACVVFDFYGQHNYFVGVIGILPEINTIFIHLRLILKITGVASKSQLYSINQMLNIATFIPFRVMPLLMVIVLVSLGNRYYGFSVLETLVWLGGSTFGTVHNYRIFVRLLAAEGYLNRTYPKLTGGNETRPVSNKKLENSDVDIGSISTKLIESPSEISLNAAMQHGQFL